MHFLRFYFVTAGAGFNKNSDKYKSSKAGNKSFTRTRVKSELGKSCGELTHNFE